MAARRRLSATRYAQKEQYIVKKIWIVFAVFVVTTGCSSKAVYDNIQHNNRQECNSAPPAQYEDCIERSSKTYEEYKREREAVIGEG